MDSVRSPFELDVDAVFPLYHKLPREQRRKVGTFVGWLWKTGTHDMVAILAIVRHALERWPSNWYRYYAPGGQARSAIVAHAMSDLASREQAERLQGLFARKQERGGQSTLTSLDQILNHVFSSGHVRPARPEPDGDPA